MQKGLTGKAFVYGPNIDTDQIYPGRFLDLTDPDQVGKHALEGADPNFVKEVQAGDIIVASTNFGCGSSREHAPLVLKVKGIKCVIAEDFARIFYRNAINIGLPVVEMPTADFENGDDLEVNLAAGWIKNHSKNLEYKIKPLPEFIQKIVQAGGLVEYVKGSAVNE